MTKKQIKKILQYVESKISKEDREGLLTLSFNNEKDEEATEYFGHSRYGYLSMIEIAKSHQGKGIARRVLTLVTEAVNLNNINLYTYPCSHCYSTLSSILEDNNWEPARGDSYNFYL